MACMSPLLIHVPERHGRVMQINKPFPCQLKKKNFFFDRGGDNYYILHWEPIKPHEI